MTKCLAAFVLLAAAGAAYAKDSLPQKVAVGTLNDVAEGDRDTATSLTDNLNGAIDAATASDFKKAESLCNANAKKASEKWPDPNLTPGWAKGLADNCTIVKNYSTAGGTVKAIRKGNVKSLKNKLPK